MRYVTSNGYKVDFLARTSSKSSDILGDKVVAGSIEDSNVMYVCLVEKHSLKEVTLFGTIEECMERRGIVSRRGVA